MSSVVAAGAGGRADRRCLTEEMVFMRTKCNRMDLIRNLNLWGNDLHDVSILRGMPNLEVLSLSVNQVSSLYALRECAKLTELYLRKNNVFDLMEIQNLAELRNLRVLWLNDNPCAQLPHYRQYVLHHLPGLSKLDSQDVSEDERRRAMRTDFRDANTCFGPVPADYYDQPDDSMQELSPSAAEVWAQRAASMEAEADQRRQQQQNYQPFRGSPGLPRDDRPSPAEQQSWSGGNGGGCGGYYGEESPSMAGRGPPSAGFERGFTPTDDLGAGDDCGSQRSMDEPGGPSGRHPAAPASWGRGGAAGGLPRGYTREEFDRFESLNASSPDAESSGYPSPPFERERLRTGSGADEAGDLARGGGGPSFSADPGLAPKGFPPRPGTADGSAAGGSQPQRVSRGPSGSFAAGGAIGGAAGAGAAGGAGGAGGGLSASFDAGRRPGSAAAPPGGEGLRQSYGGGDASAAPPAWASDRPPSACGGGGGGAGGGASSGPRGAWEEHRSPGAQVVAFEDFEDAATFPRARRPSGSSSVGVAEGDRRGSGGGGGGGGGGDAPRADNILCAVLALIKELDRQGLELVRRAVDQRQAEL